MSMFPQNPYDRPYDFGQSFGQGAQIGLQLRGLEQGRLIEEIRRAQREQEFAAEQARLGNQFDAGQTLARDRMAMDERLRMADDQRAQQQLALGEAFRRDQLDRLKANDAAKVADKLQAEAVAQQQRTITRSLLGKEFADLDPTFLDQVATLPQRDALSAAELAQKRMTFAKIRGDIKIEAQARRARASELFRGLDLQGRMTPAQAEDNVRANIDRINEWEARQLRALDLDRVSNEPMPEFGPAQTPEELLGIVPNKPNLNQVRLTLDNVTKQMRNEVAAMLRQNGIDPKNATTQEVSDAEAVVNERYAPTLASLNSKLLTELDVPVPPAKGSRQGNVVTMTGVPMDVARSLAPQAKTPQEFAKLIEEWKRKNAQPPQR